jgi:PAS domain S-box-containing protein/putative nucleotidyltransferase with HDIG domain
MNREQTLAVLYDLTLTIGSESTVDDLCRKVLQRLLFHTGLPAGVAVLKCAADSPLRMKYSLGDHVLAQRQGQAIDLPAEFLDEPVALLDRPSWPASLQGSRPYRHCLKLPLVDDGALLLLTPERVGPMPPLEIFPPVLKSLKRALNLCRNNEQLAARLAQDRDAARSDLAQTLHRTENERAFLRLLTDSIPDLIWLKDPEGVYLACNPPFERFFGHAAADIIGKTDADFVDADLARLFRDNDLAALRADTPHRNEEWLTFAMDGYRGLFETTKTPMRNADGSLVGILGIAHDITRRRQAQDEIDAQLTRVERNMQSSLQAMAKMVDLRDPYTAGHQARVAKLAEQIARRLGWPEEECRNMHIAGLMHDIGNISIPAEILAKPSKLGPLEYELIKGHVESGYEILKGLEFSFPLADIIRQHHERLDGSGYPLGLQGDAILPSARVLAVANVLEAMNSHRPYRPSLGLDASIAELQRLSGSWYDPAVVDAAVQLAREDGFLK